MARSTCGAYNDLLQLAGLEQLEVVFFGAAGCAVLAGVIAAVTFAKAQTRGLATAEVLRSAG